MTQIEEIKNRIDVVDLVGSYVKLQKAGSNYKACCPFHREKTPSFNVSPARQIWHCFGCSEGGDIFEFVKKIEGIEFPEALKILADRAGVELKTEDPRERGERGKELAILEEATKFFEGNLNLAVSPPSGGETAGTPYGYLRKRGLTEETIKEFRIGFAPAEWKSLFNHLLSKNFSAEEQERAGLIVRSQNSKFQSQNYYDRFRSRIIFPIFDYSGRVVAFGGRIFEAPTSQAVGATEAVAKYVNSPETNLYQKSKILYGLHKSKSDILKEGECVVVEGYMDWLMSWQAGVRNIVASSGTALTETQLKILRRLSEKLIAAFDMDKAGEAAAARGIELALAEGFEVRVVGELTTPPSAPLFVKEGVGGGFLKDPADAVLADPAIWQNAVKNSRHIVQFYIDSSLKKFPAASAESKREFQKSVIPVVARLSDLEKAHWVQVVGVSLGINEEAVWSAVKNHASKNKSAGAGIQEMRAVDVKPISRKELLENRILGIAAKYPAFILSSDNELDGSLFSGDKSVIFNGIKQKDLPAGRQDKGLEVFQELISRLTLEAELFLEGVGIARKATAEGAAYADAETEFIICKRELTKEVLKEKRGIISKELQSVEKKGGDVQALLADFQKINTELSKLN